MIYDSNQAAQIAIHYHNLVVGIHALEGKGYPPEELNPFRITGNIEEAITFFRSKPYREDINLRTELKLDALDERLYPHHRNLVAAFFGKVGF